jgi:hypothetical protein
MPLCIKSPILIPKRYETAPRTTHASLEQWQFAGAVTARKKEIGRGVSLVDNQMESTKFT